MSWNTRIQEYENTEFREYKNTGIREYETLLLLPKPATAPALKTFVLFSCLLVFLFSSIKHKTTFVLSPCLLVFLYSIVPSSSN